MNLNNYWYRYNMYQSKNSFTSSTKIYNEIQINVIQQFKWYKIYLKILYNESSHYLWFRLERKHELGEQEECNKTIYSDTATHTHAKDMYL